MSLMEQNPQQPRRPWLYGAAFVWVLIGAVAFATYSSRVPPSEPKIAALPEIGGAEKPPASPKMPSVAPAPPRVMEKKRAVPTKIVWEPNFETAMQKARQQNKPLLIDFYTDWCSACKEMDRAVYPNKKVIAESANWVVIRINAEQRPDVASAYGVTGYPTIVFAETTGKPLTILPGYDPGLDFAATMASIRNKFNGVSL